ncbi:MAG: iron-sulfur cluster biosynthesis family protein [Elusimicrobiales bacterium]|nr:iron-sulfur cluster biosynthesis family protein [Elusimicrobiales bacterium]
MEIKDAAIEKLKAIIKEHKKGACLRVFMTEGCCGPSVAMDLVEKPGKDDLEVLKKDLKLYVHKDAQLHLAKAVIDCGEDGEIVVTGLPDPEGGCGCGH